MYVLIDEEDYCCYYVSCSLLSQRVKIVHGFSEAARKQSGNSNKVNTHNGVFSLSLSLSLPLSRCHKKKKKK